MKHFPVEIQRLREQYNDGEITEKYLTRLCGDGTINKSELSYIVMRDIDFINRHNPSMGKNNYSKWWQSPSDKRWRIRLDGKLYVKTKKEDLDKVILDYYKGTDTSTVEDMFSLFVEERKQMCYIKTYATEKKYLNDFRRFFLNDTEDFALRKIDTVSKEQISMFFRRTIERLNLNVKTFNALYNYTKGLFEYSYSEGFIEENPFLRIKKGVFLSFCREKDVFTKEEFATDDDLKRMFAKIELTKQTSDTLTPYAYMFCMLTGARRSEPCGLKWSDIGTAFDGSEVICIQRRVVEDRENHSVLVCNPKGNKKRFIPLTEPLKELFNEIKILKQEHGIVSEWIFGSSDTPMNPNKISNFGRDRKGHKNHTTPTKLRKAFNSRLKTTHSLTVEQSASYLGNSVIVNNNFYTYEIGDMEKKAKASTEEQKRVLSLKSVTESVTKL